MFLSVVKPNGTEPGLTLKSNQLREYLTRDSGCSFVGHSFSVLFSWKVIRFYLKKLVCRTNKMFSLKNYRGSCWVNACLQGLFRIPEVQQRFTEEKADPANPLETSLQKIWNSKGTEGLKEFFDSVKNVSLPTGRGTADSHELLIYILDKLPWLEDLCKFAVVDKISCTKCDYTSECKDTKIELSLFPDGIGKTVSECIAHEVQETLPEGSKCEKCGEPYRKQLLLGSFPKVLLLHVYTEAQKRTEYCSNLIVNGRKYILLSVLSYNGAHWWAYGRDGQGKSWWTLDDTRVTEHKPNEFPLSHTMRMLIYYQIHE